MALSSQQEGVCAKQQDVKDTRGVGDRQKWPGEATYTSELVLGSADESGGNDGETQAGVWVGETHTSPNTQPAAETGGRLLQTGAIAFF